MDPRGTSVPSIGVGDGGQGARPPPPKKNLQKYFSANYYVNFGHFSGKNYVKVVSFVNFSGKYCHSDCGLLACLLTYLHTRLADVYTKFIYAVCSPMQLGPRGCGLSEPQLIAISSSWAPKIILGKALALWSQLSLSLSSRLPACATALHLNPR